jgi:protein CpxP
MPPMMNRLNLSDQQREQLRGVADSHRDELRPLVERERTARGALQAAITSDSFNEGTVREQANAVAQVEADLAVLRARAFSEAFQILTPEQQSRLKTLQAQATERRGQRPPRGRGGRI